MIFQYIVYFTLLGISVQANNGSEATFQNNLSIRRHFAENLENGNRKGQIITSAKDLLVELGNNTKRIIEESIYNETGNVEICWKHILYVNESAHMNESNGETTHWQEYQVVFDFPSEDNQFKNKSPKEYKQYKIHAGDEYMQVFDFELIHKHPNYTISKYENVSCGKGSFLSKTYYEWPKTSQKKLVVRLSNDYTQFDREEDGIIQKVGNDEDVFVGSPRDSLRENLESTTVTVPQVNKTKAPNSEGKAIPKNSTDDATEAKSLDGMYIKVQNKSINKNPVTTPPYPHLRKTSTSETVLRNEDSTKIETAAALPNESIEFSSEDVEISKKMVNSTSLDDKPGSVCSPFITQLVTGNDLFQGLCNLKKDEKVILQGDIFVRKKYVDEKNHEVMLPLFVIHENTEIEGSIDEGKEATTTAANSIN